MSAALWGIGRLAVGVVVAGCFAVIALASFYEVSDRNTRRREAEAFARQRQAGLRIEQERGL